MNIKPESLKVRVEEDALHVEIDGKRVDCDRVVRAFPKTHSDSFVSFLDPVGHEIGLLESSEGMDLESRSALLEHLKRLYFVPTIQEVISVGTAGTSSRWRVKTDDGEKEFQVASRESLDGEKPPAIKVTDSEGRRYQIVDYWELDKDSQAEMQELLPDKIVKSKLVARKSSGMTMRMR